MELPSSIEDLGINEELFVECDGIMNSVDNYQLDDMSAFYITNKDGKAYYQGLVPSKEND